MTLWPQITVNAAAAGQKVRIVRAVRDNVTTDPRFARRIVQHFAPQFRHGDTFLDPCRGNGSAFYDALPTPRDWCEIRAGRDFLKYPGRWTWIITNPPWSSPKLRAVRRRAYEIADNVVFLIRLQSGLSTYSRLRDPLDHGHRLKEIMVVKWEDAGWSKEGFALAVFHWQRGYVGDLRLHDQFRSSWRSSLTSH